MRRGVSLTQAMLTIRVSPDRLLARDAGVSLGAPKTRRVSPEAKTRQCLCLAEGDASVSLS